MSYDDGYSFEFGDDGPYSVDLEYADKGFRLCDECLGQGTYMYYKCAGGEPYEAHAYCDACNGEGQVEIKPKASISRNKREGRFAGKRWCEEIKKLTRTGHRPGNQFLALRGIP